MSRRIWLSGLSVLLTLASCSSPSPGTTAKGEGRFGPVTLHVTKTKHGYELRDRSRAMWREHHGESDRGEIITRNGGPRAYEDSGYQSPDSLRVESSPNRTWPDNARGQVDVHHDAGEVYEYFRSLGRDSIDGRGGSITVVTHSSRDKRVSTWIPDAKTPAGGWLDVGSYDGGLDQFAAAFTQGVVAAELGHEGDRASDETVSIREGFPLYFGNAAEVVARHVAAGDSSYSRFGARACVAPCVGADLAEQVGVHEIGREDSPLVTASLLWRLRSTVGPKVADQSAYDALVALPTRPTLLELRSAYLKALPADMRDRAQRVFDDWGVVPDWQKLVRQVDATMLATLPRRSEDVSISGRTWAAIQRVTDNRLRLWFGGPGSAPRLAARGHILDASVRNGVLTWSTVSKERSTLWRSDHGHRPQRVAEIPYWIGGSTQDGADIAWLGTLSTSLNVRINAVTRTWRLGKGEYVPQGAWVLHKGVVAAWVGQSGTTAELRVWDPVTGRVRTLARSTGNETPRLTVSGDSLVYVRNGTTIYRSTFDGHQQRVLARGNRITQLTANGAYVFYSGAGRYDNRILRMVAVSGRKPVPYSCTGSSTAMGAGPATTLTWVDLSSGRPRLLTRSKPIGTCPEH